MTGFEPSGFMQVLYWLFSPSRVNTQWCVFVYNYCARPAQFTNPNVTTNSTVCIVHIEQRHKNTFPAKRGYTEQSSPSIVLQSWSIDFLELSDVYGCSDDL